MPSSATATNETQRYRKSMASIVSFIRKKRIQLRQKTTFNPPENFVDIENINKGDYELSPEKLEFFYPSSKNQVNWGYTSDSMTIAAKADIKFLKERFPLKRPDASYFEEREKEALFDKRFALRFPPLFYISKFSFSKIILRVFFRAKLRLCANDIRRR